MMTKALRCVLPEVRKIPYYDGLIDIYLFLDDFEHKVPKDHCFQALELELRTIPTQWWGTHQDSFVGW